MDKQQARDLIKKTFEQSFDKMRFTTFVQELLNHIEHAPFNYYGSYIPEAYRQYISSLERIGKFNDGENRIDILIIKLQKETSLASARTMQRNFVAGYLQGKYGSSSKKEAVLVAYVAPDEADWRFSLVKMDYKFAQAPTGKMKAEEELTSARRWSFLVGENEKSHTAQSRLVNILTNDEHNPTLDELEEAFNIESVTKEFFLKYRDLFIRTKEALDEVVQNNSNIKNDFEAKGVNTVDFAKKLLGQIIFLYFLQKKGWFGVGRYATWGTGSKQFLRELFEKKHSGYNNFFNDILEPLFYEALRIGEERKQDDYYYSRFNCKIPFLNGGLFDPIGDYDWVHTDMLLPDSLFSNFTKTKEEDTGDGILDIFDRYNFTVREDEPLEKEVAIDPELLGKAYEKFNAIRPDNFEEYKIALKSGKKGNESKFNRQYGVYYTPREIVHYMCQQSLICYLMTELNGDTVSYEKVGECNLDMFGNRVRKGQLDITIEHKNHPAIPKEDIDSFILLGEQFWENDEIALIKEKQIKNGIQKSSTIEPMLPESIRKNASLIDEKLENITICDPAVGSGAFPVGMMNEIIKARNVLTPYLEDDFRTIYNFKRQCIEKSLYGVDIDPGAVEIAKLRLWLSLIVEEQDFKEIKPLPNLDYKIMQGNSLISEFMDIDLDNEDTQQNEKLQVGLLFELEDCRLIKKFEQKKIDFQNESDIDKKAKLKEEVEELMVQVFEDKLTKKYAELEPIEDIAQGIPNLKTREEYMKTERAKVTKKHELDLENIKKQLKEFANKKKTRPFFLWKLYFAEVFEKGGFDIMIANPPYLSSKNIDNTLKPLYEKTFYSPTAHYDIYIIFIEKSLQLLNKNGIICFITSNKYFSQKYGSKIREILLGKHLLRIINFNFKIFEATVDTAIIIARNSNTQIDSKVKILNLHNTVLKNKTPLILRDILLNETKYLTIKQNFFKELPDSNFRLDIHQEDLDLLEKINRNKISLEEICFVIYGAVLHNAEKNVKKDKFIYREKSKDLKPYVEGKFISRWRINEVLYLKYTPHIHREPRYPELFENTKLLGKRIIGKEGLSFLYDQNNIYVDNTVYIIISYSSLPQNKYRQLNSVINIDRIQLSKKYSLLFLLAIINSSLFKWLFQKFFSFGLDIYPAHLKRLPIKTTISENQKPFIEIVEKILAITKSYEYLQNPDMRSKVQEYERQIDQLVYQLYGLTEDEIKIVENFDKKV